MKLNNFKKSKTVLKERIKNKNENEKRGSEQHKWGEKGKKDRYNKRWIGLNDKKNESSQEGGKNELNKRDCWAFQLEHLT